MYVTWLDDMEENENSHSSDPNEHTIHALTTYQCMLGLNTTISIVLLFAPSVFFISSSALTHF